MKDKIHPKYLECAVTCGCGETFQTRATQPEINVEICSKCHPFYTGKQKLVDTAGRVEKFQRRYANAAYRQSGEQAGDRAEEPTAEPADEPVAEPADKPAAEPSVETADSTENQ